MFFQGILKNALRCRWFFETTVWCFGLKSYCFAIFQSHVMYVAPARDSENDFYAMLAGRIARLPQQVHWLTIKRFSWRGCNLKEFSFHIYSISYNVSDILPR